MRSATVLTDSVNTAAIRIAYTETSASVVPRPNVQTPGSRSGPDTIATRLVAVTAPWNSIARKSRPLPRKTVEKRRSSTSPSWSRTTPMNQRNAIPANGTRFRARRTSVRRPGSSSIWPTVSPATASRIITSAAMSSTAKTIPATAADRRLRQRRATSPGAGVVTGSSWQGASTEASRRARTRPAGAARWRARRCPARRPPRPATRPAPGSCAPTWGPPARGSRGA